MWQALIDEFQRGAEKGGMGMSSGQEWGAFSPAGAVVFELSLVQLHGQVWERDQRHERMSGVQELRYPLKSKTIHNTFSLHTFLRSYLLAERERHFTFPLTSVFSPLTIYPSIRDAPALVWPQLPCETPWRSTPPSLQCCTCSAPSEPYGRSPLASGRGTAAVLQQASLTV